MPEFNPYHKWLGIPKNQASPTHYQILGVPRDETDRDVINAAAVRQSMYVRNFQKGPHADEATRILAEIEESKLVLLDPEKRKAYDQTLGARKAIPVAVESPPVAGPQIRAKPQRVRRFSANRNIGLALTAGALVAAVLLVVWAMNRQTSDEQTPAQDVAASSNAISKRQVTKKPSPSKSGEEKNSNTNVVPPERKPKPPSARKVKSEPPLAIAPFDAEAAKRHQQAWADFLGIPVEMTNPIGMKLVLIPPGEFDMGSTQEELDQLLSYARHHNLPQGHIDRLPGEAPQHRVRITHPFYLGKYEVTQQQWEAVMGDNPSQFRGPQNPVQMVSWNDCYAFLKKLQETLANQAGTVSLPTEAQWEFACRAGTSTRYSFGNDEANLGQYCWYDDNSADETNQVGQKKPNAWGLHDMYGNVWEWCQDYYDLGYYAGSSRDDPTGPATGSDRVRRGGSWYTGDSYCRSAVRSGFRPSRPSNKQGFRVVLTPLDVLVK